MLIRKLTLAAFAIFGTTTSSLALLANAAQHATPALADQNDYGYDRQRHDRDDRRPADRYGNDGTWYGPGYRGDDGRGYGDERHGHDRDRDRDHRDRRDRNRDEYDPHN